MDTQKPDLQGTLTSARDAAKQIYNAEDRVSLLVKIANAQATEGYSDDAKKSFELALDSIGQADDLLLEIAKGQAKAGFFTDAEQTAQSIKHLEKKAEALLSIAESWQSRA